MKIEKCKETMTSKERIRKTFAFEKTDRVPIGYSANPEIHKKLCADFPDEYRAYRKEKKRTATTQTKLQTVAVTLYGIMMIFSAFRIFSTPDSVVFWAAVVLFSVLFAFELCSNFSLLSPSFPGQAP